MDASNTTVTILYGSQTGNAEDLAKRIGYTLKSKGFSTLVQTIDDFPLKSLTRLSYVLFVCSTTGHGQEPENMKTFYNFIRRRDLPNNCLTNLNFTVYGLGNSSYAKFNYVSKVLFRRLSECGAKPLQELVIGDEQHRLGLDGAIYPKLEELYSLLEYEVHGPNSLPHLRVEPRSSYSVKFLCPSQVTMSFKNSLSFVKEEFIAKFGLKVARCVLNQRITPDEHFQDTRLLSFESNERIAFEPGDVCTILPENPDYSVDQFIKILSLDAEQSVELSKLDHNYMINYLYDFAPSGIKIRDLVKLYMDIHSIPRRSFFEFLSLFSDDQLEHQKLLEFASTEGQEEMYEYCIQPKRSILEVLLDFPHTVSNIKFEYLFDLVPPIKPRSFSIASAPQASKNQLDLVVGVVSYKTRLRKVRKGLCSNYLARLVTHDEVKEQRHHHGNEIKFYLHRSSFKLPENVNTPILMIGPGLGIAPFRSFIQQRVQTGVASSTNTFLYFGCRYESADFYFREELEALVVRGLIRMRVAYSRQNPKMYVQDLLLEDCAIVRDLVINRQATIYVAGNSKLPEDLRSVFAKILVQDDGDTELLAQGERLVAELEQKNRILYDCW